MRTSLGRRLRSRSETLSPRAPRPSRPVRGFTLIEVLIVVGVIGILAAISISALQLLIPRWRLQEAGNQLDTVIKRARLIAIQRQLQVVIGFEDEADTSVLLADMDRFTVYYLVARGPSPALGVPGDVVASSPMYAFSNGVDVDAITFPGETISFDALGQAATTGEIIFGYPTDPPHRRQLSVEITTINGMTSQEESTT